MLAADSATAEVDFYGKLNVTLQNADEAAGDHVELQSNASRVGIKGEESLDAGLKVIYQLEWEVDPESEGGVDNIRARNQFIGLEGSLGTVKVGRHDTALKESQGDFDLFDDLEGDIDRTFNGENRLRDYIGYTTPTFADAFSVTLNFFPGEDPVGGNDSAADSTSVSISYETDLVYAAVAHDRDVDAQGTNTTRLVGGYTPGAAKLMLLYQQTDAEGRNADGFSASITYTFGDNTAKLQYADAGIWRTSIRPDPLTNLLESQISVGLDHALGKNTKLFGFYTAGDIGGTSESNKYVALGLEHSF